MRQIELFLLSNTLLYNLTDDCNDMVDCWGEGKVILPSKSEKPKARAKGDIMQNFNFLNESGGDLTGSFHKTQENEMKKKIHTLEL